MIVLRIALACLALGLAVWLIRPSNHRRLLRDAAGKRRALGLDGNEKGQSFALWVAPVFLIVFAIAMVGIDF